jgi:hypothetical protein
MDIKALYSELLMAANSLNADNYKGYVRNRHDVNLTKIGYKNPDISGHVFSICLLANLIYNKKNNKLTDTRKDDRYRLEILTRQLMNLK